MSAKEAYKAYIRAYDSHHLKTIFDVHTLDLAKAAQSFSFKVPRDENENSYFSEGLQNYIMNIVNSL